MRTIIIVLCIESRDFLHRPEDNLNAQFQWEWNVGTTFFKNPQTAHNNWSGSAVCQQIDWTWECTSRGTHSAMGGRVPVAVSWSGGFDFKTFNNWSSAIQCNIPGSTSSVLNWRMPVVSTEVVFSGHACKTHSAKFPKRATNHLRHGHRAVPGASFFKYFFGANKWNQTPCSPGSVVAASSSPASVAAVVATYNTTDYNSPLSVQSTLPLHWLPTSPSTQPASQPSRPPINSKRIGPRTI